MRMRLQPVCVLLILSFLLSYTASSQQKSRYDAYLFVYFTGNAKSDEAIRFAVSKDGYHFIALRDNKAILGSDTISETGGIRDPHILRSTDGKTFYMVATDMISAKGWDSNRGLVLMKSKDLINWSHAAVNIQKNFPGQEQLLRVWAPQTIYDDSSKSYMVYWAMKYKDGTDKIYYAHAGKDFTSFTESPKLLYESPLNKSVIDADIVKKDGKYHLFFKTEGDGNGIRQAMSSSLTHGYEVQNDYLQQTDLPVEGSCVFKLNAGAGYILMYDMYTSGKYQFAYSEDLRHFKKVADDKVSMNFHPRHGTILPITSKEAYLLESAWLNERSIITWPQSGQIKRNNVSFDTATLTASFILKPDVPVKAVNPGFIELPGVSIQPSGKVDFSKGKVSYTVRIGQKAAKTFTVRAAIHNNPVLDGYYADPEVMYSRKTGRFYIYPTSDGYTGWSGNYFKVFSSPDLVHWQDSGKILQLGKDVTWTNRNAWAPCITEKAVNGDYRYYYYFCAAQKIGVAVSDNPTGPFKDLGHPLIDHTPPGVKSGQQIDPAVFTDPQSGKGYLFWGNGYMAGVELNNDMVSLNDSTITVLTPDKTFREGVYVFFRKGVYYYMWSENDTRDENYDVRYGMSGAPLSKIKVPDNNLVIAKSKNEGIFGTGHNAVLQIPGTDDWYIVYHRFNFPNGVHWGDAAGYNREVCIDKLEFNSDGTIKQVIPTHQGIGAVKVKP